MAIGWRNPQAPTTIPGLARTGREMAVHLDMTTQRITQLANEGVLPPPGRRQIPARCNALCLYPL